MCIYNYMLQGILVLVYLILRMVLLNLYGTVKLQLNLEGIQILSNLNIQPPHLYERRTGIHKYIASRPFDDILSDFLTDLLMTSATVISI